MTEHKSHPNMSDSLVYIQAAKNLRTLEETLPGKPLYGAKLVSACGWVALANERIKAQVERWNQSGGKIVEEKEQGMRVIESGELKRMMAHLLGVDEFEVESVRATQYVVEIKRTVDGVSTPEMRFVKIG